MKTRRHGIFTELSLVKAGRWSSRRGHLRDRPRRLVGRGLVPSLPLVLTLALLPAVGCSGSLGKWMHRGWAADYETAERRVSKTGRGLLILYQELRPGGRYPVEEALKKEPLSERIDGYVRCKLLKSYEPDRRYVAQFDVHRAPALILVHGDGTYHARAGSMSAADIAAFLDEAKPPGKQPVLNPYIPRRARYDWHRTLESAEETANETRKPILIVYHRSLTSDWRELQELLTRQEVYRRFADMVHCRVSVLTFSADTEVARFGTLKLPALVIARGDGTHDILELPTSYEAIVRFADNARRRAEASGADETASVEP